MHCFKVFNFLFITGENILKDLEFLKYQKTGKKLSCTARDFCSKHRTVGSVDENTTWLQV